MDAQGAAPGGGTPGHGRINENSRSLLHLGIPARVIACLEREGVRSLQDWARLGRKRHGLFGITRAMVRQIDAAAREAAK